MGAWLEAWLLSLVSSAFEVVVAPNQQRCDADDEEERVTPVGSRIGY